MYDIVSRRCEVDDTAPRLYGPYPGLHDTWKRLRRRVREARPLDPSTWTVFAHDPARDGQLRRLTGEERVAAIRPDRRR